MRPFFIQRACYLVGLLVVTLQPILASDSLVRLNDLTFINATEREAFKRLQQQNEPLLELLCTPYGRDVSLLTASVPETIRAFAQKLSRDLEKTPEKKKPIKVYEAIQSQFLKHYELENSMIEVFEKGWYNCVSGTALHALVFDLLNIPYQIREQPKHVFIVAYPGTHNVIIETTAPEKGYLPVNGKMAETFVRYLLIEQVISENDYKSEEALSIFNRHYYAKGNLSLHELTALQYCNYGVYASERDQYAQALMYFKKAYYISPSKTAYDGMQLAAIQLQLSETLNGDVAFRHFNFMCRLYAHQKSISLKELLLKQFETYVKSYKPVSQTKTEPASTKNTVNYADSAIRKLQSFFSDSLFANEAAYYHYEVARLKILDKQLDAELEKHLEQLMALKPDDIDARYLVFSWFALKHENTQQFDELLTDMTRAETRFPFLKTYPNFLTVRYTVELGRAADFFAKAQQSKGDLALKNFEAHYLALPGVVLDEKLVEQVYGTAASYYFRMGQTAKTREILKRGLTIYPDHLGLMRRLDEAR